MRWVKRILLIATLLVVALVVGLVLGFEPMGRWMADREADKRGLDLEFEELDMGWAQVSMHGVLVRLEGVEGVEVKFDEIVLELSSTMRPERVYVNGAQVEIQGEFDTVVAELQAWKTEHRSAAPGVVARSATGGGGVEFDGRGISVTWRDAVPGGPLQEMTGIDLNRRADGSVDLAVARIALESAAAQLVVEDLQARTGRRAVVEGDGDTPAPKDAVQRQGQSLRMLTAARVDLSLAVEFERFFSRVRAALGVADDSDQDATAGVPPPQKDAPPSGRVPKPGAPASGSDVVDDGAEVKNAQDEGGVGSKLRALLELATRNAERALLPDATVDLSGFRVAIRDGDKTFGIGPGRLTAGRNPGGLAIEFVPGRATGVGGGSDDATTPLAFDVKIPFADEPLEAELVGGPVSLTWLGIRDGDGGLVDTGRTLVRVNTRVSLSADATELRVDGSGSIANLSINKPWLSAETVADIQLGGDLRGRFSTDRRSAEIEYARIDLNGIVLEATAKFDRSSEGTTFELKGELPTTGCQHLLNSIPQGFAPDLSGFELTGSVGFELDIAFDSTDKKATKARWDLDNRCRILRAPSRFLPVRFRQPFELEVETDDGYLAVITGPGTRDWYPLDEISPYMETAVVVSEDSRFWRHEGIDPKAVSSAIRDNLNARRFFRGASTITMQLAKNLYLTRTKTLSRKLQEALLTLLLEQQLSKEEILELYLNVIEYGPSVYGIGSASRYYFGTTPSQLTLGQALYLGSILPRPSLSHFEEDGTLNPRWALYLKRLMRISHQLKRISDEELEAGMAEEVVMSPDDAVPGGGDAADGLLDWDWDAADGPRDGPREGPGERPANEAPRRRPPPPPHSPGLAPAPKLPTSPRLPEPPRAPVRPLPASPPSPAGGSRNVPNPPNGPGVAPGRQPPREPFPSQPF